MLSEESKDCLKTLLPPTAFNGYKEVIGEDHPSLETVKQVMECSKHEPMGTTGTTDGSAMDVDDDQKPNGGQPAVLSDATSLASGQELNFAFFTDPHFLAAMRTFQDHLYLNWFTDAHLEKVRQFQEGVTKGTLSAPWKDEEWERHNCPLVSDKDARNGVLAGLTKEGSLSAAKAGSVILLNYGGCTLIGVSLRSGAAEIKLSVLVKQGIIRAGDVLAFKRSFATHEVIEKDCIVSMPSIKPCFGMIEFLSNP